MPKQLLIIGNGLSAMTFIEELLAQDGEWKVTFCTQDEFKPYFSSKIPEYLAGKVSSPELFYWSDKKFEAKDVAFTGKVLRINFNKKEVTLDSKERLGYDGLLLADFPNARITEIKGANKEGIYTLGRLEDAARYLKRITLTESVAVAGRTPAALSTALACAERGKEVFYITETEDPFAGFLSEDDSCILREKVKETGIRFLTGHRVTEILGESEVKAVRLGSGKVFAVEAVWWDMPLPDFRWIKDADWFSGGGIMTGDGYRTPAEGVWAFGRLLADPLQRPRGSDSDSEFLMVQGRNAARQYLGQPERQALPAPTARWKINGRAYVLTGQGLDFDRKQMPESQEPLGASSEEERPV